MASKETLSQLARERAPLARGGVRSCEHWPCFHTDMCLWPKEEPRCGIFRRANKRRSVHLLIAEQMAVCEVKTVVGLASSCRIGQALALAGIVVADEAVRDEGTPLH